MSQDLLPDELLWANGGHASDVVLTALADGQIGIVPPAVRSHVEKCTTCTQHLGNAALLSLHAGGELMALRKHDQGFAPSRRPLPIVAIAIGLAVAAAGIATDLGAIRAYVTEDLPLLARGAGTLGGRLLEPGGPAGLVLTYGTAVLLVAMGFALVRLLPKKETSR